MAGDHIDLSQKSDRTGVEPTFQIVNSVCFGDQNNANCSEGNSEKEAYALHADGIFGVRPISNGDGVYSLLSELPSPLDAFVVSLGNGGDDAEVIVAPAASMAQWEGYGFQTTPRVVQNRLDNGAYYWSTDLLEWCYTVHGSRQTLGCSPDVFTDTGGLQAHLVLPGAAEAIKGLPRDQVTTLPNGIAIDAGVQGAPSANPPLWSFTTGNCLFNTVRIVDQTSAAVPVPAPTDVNEQNPLQSNNGINPFFGYEILYDLKNGLFGMRRVSTKPSFC
jgi:hypothetical protein